MQPVDHLDAGIKFEPLQRRHPRLEDFETADRAVMAALPWRLQPRGPGRADAADVDQRGIARLRRVDGDLAGSNFTLTNHRSIHPHDPSVDELQSPRPLEVNAG